MSVSKWVNLGSEPIWINYYYSFLFYPQYTFIAKNIFVAPYIFGNNRFIIYRFLAYVVKGLYKIQLLVDKESDYLNHW